MASIKRKISLPPSNPGIGKRLNIPKFIVMNIVKLKTEYIFSLIFRPVSAASPIAFTSPTGPDRS